MTTQQHEPVTQDLINLIAQQPQIRKYLDDSLAAAKKLSPDPKLNPAQDFDSYLTYLDWASQLAPQEILNNPSDLIRDQILQSICYFYFLLDQPITGLPETYYKQAIQYYPPFSDWCRKFCDTWGAYLSTPNSWSSKQYQQFYADPKFRLATGDYESPENWHTFNEFFSRYLSSPSKRPISNPGDKSVVVSPADSVPQGQWSIDSRGRIMVNDGLQVKNVRYFNVKDLLGPKSSPAYQDAFNDGVLTHTFLNVFDYHRYHFPVGGTIKLAPEIVQQNVALEVSFDSSLKRYVPIDSTGWQFTQTRGIVIVETENYGVVAVIPMGMAHVSSVNFEADVQAGNSVAKGDMLGTFLFGGSDYIILFSKDAKFRITAPTQRQFVHDRELNQFSTPVGDTFKHILMGEEYGKMGG